MYENFHNVIEELYDLILKPFDSVLKKEKIHHAKKIMGCDAEKSFGEIYVEYAKFEKRFGVIYTPEHIARYIVENTISTENIIDNPFMKIIDPACGTGNILIPCFTYLRKIYMENLDVINAKHKLKLDTDTINYHIIKNNIYGIDIDELSIKILSIDLFDESYNVVKSNFFTADFLIDDSITEKFDVFLGNPPYVGHKAVDREYSSLLKDKYKGIYKDKGDISYCFFKRALEFINVGGKISFITSRYFMESPSGSELRRIIKNNLHIRKIVDFYGIRPFKNAGIDPVITFLDYSNINENTEVIRPFKNVFNSFYITEDTLQDSGWILLNDFERKILNKIESKCPLRLSDICKSNQGIITGCDNAFIVTKETVEEEHIEKDIIRPWIKGKNIDKFNVAENSKFIIYSNLIKDEDESPYAIRHISRFKEKLLSRRECKRGIRKWYELQWGRRREIFECEKIIFPYKSPSNRFALDNGSYFSADIYSIIIDNSSCVSYDFLLSILNSSIYEFYFKTYGKKLGGDLYEYYPNTVMRMAVPYMFTDDKIDEDALYSYFELSDSEVNFIETYYEHS